VPWSTVDSLSIIPNDKCRVFLKLFCHFFQDKLFGVFQGAGQECAGSHFVASADLDSDGFIDFRYYRNLDDVWLSAPSLA
jgi:hypothetical protein